MNPIEPRIMKILNTMTVREKIGQCIMIEPFFLFNELNSKHEHCYHDLLDPAFLDKILNEYHIGFLLFGGASCLGNDTSEEWANYIKQINTYAKNNGLKIPLFFGTDAVHGANFIKGSTLFSHNLGATSTWNFKLIQQYGQSVGKELRAIGINCNFAPTIDVARDQRWGRVYESLGEDPYLASQMSKALISGMQNQQQVAACAKHFIGYGESSNGLDRTPANISERTLYEQHLPPFQAAINAGVKTIMVNGGDVNGTPMPVAKKLLTNLLREELGFNGVVLSDWEDVNRLKDRHHVARSRKEAIMKTFNAGLDLNMAVTDLAAVDIMETLVIEEKISMERLDQAVANALRVKLDLGLFEQNEIDVHYAGTLTGNKKSRKIAKQIALESMTLLKNEKQLLPLSKDIKSVLITGKVANSKRHLAGGWTLGWDTAKEEDLAFPTILEAIIETIPQASITYCDSVNALESSNINPNDYDVCISIVGETPHAEWLGDSFDLAIEEDELTLLKAAYNTTIPVAMVSVIGRPVDVKWIEKHIPAVLWAYIPGSEGAEAIAELLFGDTNPSGKLAMTFPKDANQIPIVYNARKYTSYEIFTHYEPIYPFGYGLSYTTFEYGNLVVKKTSTTPINYTVEVTVKNIGNVSGQEVVQLYLEDQYASVTRPLKSLKDFTKIYLQPNESETVLFILGEEKLGLYNESLQWDVEKREIEVQISTLKTTFTIE